MEKALCRGLDDAPEVQNFLSGIVLGVRHQTPEDIEEPFQQTGTLHLFAVSGLNIAIVAALLWMLAMVARLSRKWATALIIPSAPFLRGSNGTAGFECSGCGDGFDSLWRFVFRAQSFRA